LDRDSHELFYCVISGSTELSEKLSMVEEIRPKHFGYGENPLGMSDVLEELIFEVGGKGGGSLGPT
jgi:hypothetical protein